MITASHLRAARAALGLSQAEVAAGAQVRQLQVSRCEIKGVARIRGDVVGKLAAFYDQQGVTFGRHGVRWDRAVKPASPLPPDGDAPEA